MFIVNYRQDTVETSENRYNVIIFRYNETLYLVLTAPESQKPVHKSKYVLQSYFHIKRIKLWN